MAKVPTATGQEKGYNRRTRTYYEPQRLKETRATLMDGLYPNRPNDPLTGPLSLTVVWSFKASKTHKTKTWKTTKPDTDNLQKVLKDCMTQLGFWQDDAQVCWETVFKVWDERSGIGVRIEKLGEKYTENGDVT